MNVTLSPKELGQAFNWGQERADIMAKKWNKNGYAAGNTKGGRLHTAVQSESLAIAAEMAVCKHLGYDYMDPKIYVAVAQLDANGNLPAACKQPDVAGIYEVRRSESHNDTLRLWKKDADSNAYVIHTVVDHVHYDGRVRPSGLVELRGWVEAATVYPKKVKASGVAEVRLLNTMSDLPRVTV